MTSRAWVTLATNDSYGLGALVLAHSLRRVNSAYPAVVLITPSVTDAMRDRLSAVFAEVVSVDVLDSRDAAHLALLQRPELGITFTKIHCWSLTQYEKCVFLDADTLVFQNSDELFEREELSAAPDVGWPDCFNSGVFVYRPSQETFDALIKFAQERGSFDGGDQGLLNSFFSDWATADINKHLPFLYNVTSAAFYSYLPAFKEFGHNLKIIHFIGVAKPWLQQYNWESNSVDAPNHLKDSLQLWWDIFVSSVHSHLDTSMTGVAGNLARVVPGEAGVQREAVDELTRRQGWESGNIDYMGVDAFDNIWAKISQTLSQAPTQPTTPPKEPSPPPKQPSPPKEVKETTPPKEVTKEPSPSKEPVKQKSPPKEVTKAPSPPKQIVEQPAKEPTPVKEVEPTPSPVVKAVSPPKETIKEPSPPNEVTPAVVKAPKEEPAVKAPSPPKEKQPSPPKEVPVVVASATPVSIAPQESQPPTEAVKEVVAVPKESPVATKEAPVVPPTPPATPKSTPEQASTPVTESLPELEVKTDALAQEATPSKLVDSQQSNESFKTPEQSIETSVSADSPPLANTPVKEGATVDVKATEEAAQETRL